MNNLFIAENLKVITKVLPILKIQVHQKEISLIVKRNHLIPVLIFLKNHIQYQFKVLTCISGVDYPSQKYRFKVVYELLSVRYNMRLRVKVLTDELTPIEYNKVNDGEAKFNNVNAGKEVQTISKGLE